MELSRTANENTQIAIESYHPPYEKVSYDAISLVQLNLDKFKDTANVGLINAIQELNTNGGTLYSPKNIPKLFSPVWGMFLETTNAPNDIRAIFLKGLLENIPFAFNVREKASNQFGLTLREEAKKEKKGDLGHDVMTSTGGIHKQYLECSESQFSNGQIQKVAVVKATLAILENQVVWDPNNAQHASQILQSIKSSGLTSVTRFKNGDLSFLDATANSTSVSGDVFSKDLKRILNKNNDIDLDNLNLRKGIDGIKVRVFSDLGKTFFDMPVGEYLCLSDYEAGSILVSSKNFSKYNWAKVEQIDGKVYAMDWPPIAVSSTDDLARPDSSLHKYLGSRGRSAFHFNLIDAGKKGRLVEAALGHLRVNGSDAKKICDDLSKSLGFDKLPMNKTFVFPRFIINPEIHKVEASGALKEFGLTDLDLNLELSESQAERLKISIEKINEVLIKPKSDKTYNSAKALGASDDVAKEVRNMLNSKIGRHQIFSMVYEDLIGSSVNVVLTRPQKQKEMGMAIVKSFPKEIRSRIHGVLSNFRSDVTFNKIDFEKNINLISDALTITAKVQSAARLGLSPLGFLQGFVLQSRKLAESSASLIQKTLNKKAHPTQMISDLGEGAAKFFRTSQNQNAGLSKFFGFINNNLVARINNSEPTHFNSFDFAWVPNESIIDEVFHGSENAENRKEMIYKAQDFWKRKNIINFGSNISKLNNFWSKLKNEPIDDRSKEELKQGLRDYIIIVNYTQVKRALELSVQISEKIAEALEQKKT